MFSILKRLRRTRRQETPVAAAPVPDTVAPVGPPAEPAAVQEPTIFHVTHWKAGSQWINRILHSLVYHRLVLPDQKQTQFLVRPIEPGKVYPTVYVTRNQFDRVQIPKDSRRFVVIRDLRDTLISHYFSIKVSHHMPDDKSLAERKALVDMSVEDGLLQVMRDWMVQSAAIQESWLLSGEPLLRYEDLLTDDLEILERVLLGQCQLRVPRHRFVQVVLANRFERLTNGRQRGQEDMKAHERKGIGGDWRNHFTPRVKGEFKEMFGKLLVDTGYEKDLDW